MLLQKDRTHFACSFMGDRLGLSFCDQSCTSELLLGQIFEMSAIGGKIDASLTNDWHCPKDSLENFNCGSPSELTQIYMLRLLSKIKRMKKVFLFALAASVVSLSACGQKVKESAVPAGAKQAFTGKFPGIAATWEKEDGNYEVSFKKDGKSMSQLITAKGVVEETETDIAVTELPEAARTYLQQHYKGAKIKESAKIEKAGRIEYEAEVNGKDVIFDANGTFIKEVKE
jgi:hypothetical protein